MIKWIRENLINIGLGIIFIVILVLIILGICKLIILPDYGLIFLPLGMILIILIARGDFSFKLGDLLEVKKDIGSVKDELILLNTKINNINTNQNITILSVSAPDMKEILNQVKSKTILSDSDIVIKSPQTEIQNGDSNFK